MSDSSISLPHLGLTSERLVELKNKKLGSRGGEREREVGKEGVGGGRE